MAGREQLSIPQLFEKGVNPRSNLINDETLLLLSENISLYELTQEGFLDRAAKISLLGGQPTLRNIFTLDSENEYIDSRGFQRACRDYMKDAANAKILGIHQKPVSDAFHTEMQNLVSENSVSRDYLVTSISNNENTWWSLLPYAKILGLNVDLVDGEKERIQTGIKSSENYYLKNFQQAEFDNEDYRTFFWTYGALASSLAQARMLGIDVVINQSTADMIQTSIKRVTDETFHWLPQMATDYSIISAKEVKVGGPRGLELVF